MWVADNNFGMIFKFLMDSMCCDFLNHLSQQFRWGVSIFTFMLFDLSLIIVRHSILSGHLLTNLLVTDAESKIRN